MLVPQSSFKVMPVSLFALALVVPVPAQLTSTANEVQSLGPSPSSCPISLQASQRSVSQQVEAGGPMPNPPAQGLTVRLASLRTPRIASAEVVAHALSPKNRTVLTSSLDDADVVQAFHLSARPDGGFNLWMEGVTSIRWIELKSLAYSDGSVWHESGPGLCTARPDPTVLVSSAR